MDAGLIDLWSGFVAEHRARAQRLAEELASCWSDLAALLASAEEELRRAPTPDGEAFSVLEAAFSGHSGSLLLDLLASYRRKRPLDRSLRLIRDFHSGMADLAQQLPETAELTGPDRLALAGAAPGWRSQFLRWRKSATEVHLRTMASACLAAEFQGRLKAYGHAERLLAAGSLHLAGPWRIFRARVLAAVSNGAASSLYQRDAEQWVAQTRKWSAEAETVFAGFRPGPQLGACVLGGCPSPSQIEALHDEATEAVTYWSRQARDVHTGLDLEQRLQALGAAMVAGGLRHIGQAMEERTAILAELNAVNTWLTGWAPGDASFPAAQAQVTAWQERHENWLRQTANSIEAMLPPDVELVDPKSDMPGWRPPWRELQPAAIFLSALEAAAAQAASGFRELDGSHQAIVRDIERARQSVEYGLEEARADAAGVELARQSVENALSLAGYRTRITPPRLVSAEDALARAIALTLADSYAALEKNRIGLWALVTRRRGLAAAAQALALGRDSAWRSAKWIRRRATAGWRYLLREIGLAAPERSRRQPLWKRPTLSALVGEARREQDLPALYRRLFRLEPVEDARFLIGRHREMAGLGAALEHWKNSQPTAVLLVGARGSGKTSLLNCAQQQIFGSETVFRAQFVERVTSPEGVREFLARTAGVADALHLTDALNTGRRVIVLEELERTFLCVIDGAAALRHLLDIVHATARNTLWVLSINESAFQFLHAMLRLGDQFTHRINAMTVEPEDLRNALMQRHYLSGLRLEFAPVPRRATTGRLARIAQFTSSPEDYFFGSLYDRSEGVFRGAFELWQQSIQRIEGGVLYMNQLPAINEAPLRRQLDQTDLFLLRAILHHGSLHSPELAQVLAIDQGQSSSRVTRLRQLDLLEPEPLYPETWRIRPSAGQFVRSVLLRNNLR